MASGNLRVLRATQPDDLPSLYGLVHRPGLHLKYRDTFALVLTVGVMRSTCRPSASNSRRQPDSRLGCTVNLCTAPGAIFPTRSEKPGPDTTTLLTVAVEGFVSVTIGAREHPPSARADARMIRRG